MKKLKFEEVEKEFTQRGYILLDKEYISNSHKMSIMNSDGYKTEIALGNLKCGKQPSFFSIFNKYTIENIQLFLERKGEGTILLSTEFVGNDKKLLFKCSCGTEFERAWGDLSTSVYTSCQECINCKRGANKRNKYEDVKADFEHRTVDIEVVDYDGEN